MTGQLLVPGTIVSENPDTNDDAPDIVVQVSSPRGRLGGQTTVDLPDDHVIEVELENGLILFQRREHLVQTSATRGDASSTAELPRALNYGPATRAGQGLLVRFYRFFFGDKAAKQTVRKLAQQIEKGQTDTLKRAETPMSLHKITGALPTDRPLLILLHGTFSSAAGSFGNLIDGPWAEISAQYGGHTYAFEHRTLTADPIQNAIDLLKQLPAGAELHLMSHSRGGLVGEVLARCGRVVEEGGAIIDNTDIEIFKKLRDTADADLERLAELAKLFADKAPRITRFVRVACPARGTLLASKRLDLYLSVIFNLINLIPGPQRVVLTPLQRFIREIVRSRADVSTLSGLEAQMPRAPLIAMLNRSDVRVSGPLHIVAGDSEPGGVLSALGLIAADLFFLEQHDFVVNTQAMDGGAGRTDGRRILSDRGSAVSHFAYFRNVSSTRFIVEALRGDLPPTQAERVAAPSTLRGTTHDVITGDRPVCLILPGIMGTELGTKSRSIWPNFLELMWGGIEKIGAQADGKPAPGVVTRGAVTRYYGGLVKAVLAEGTHDAVVVDYDWRLSLTVAADRLAAKVSRALDLTQGADHPIRLIAHSMGGLVARRMIVQHPSIWARLKARKGARLIMLGTPNGGAVSMAMGLLGQDKMIRQLETLDFTNDLGELLNVISPLPGVLELLPTDEDHRYFDPEFWQGADHGVSGLNPPPTSGLRAASRVVGDLVLDEADRDMMLYVAGKAPVTPVKIETNPLKLIGTARGDGRVTWQTGCLPGVETWFALDTEHGDLSRNSRLFPAYLDLLKKGDTRLLPQTPPAARGGRDSLFEITPETPLYPTDQDVWSLGMGASDAGSDTAKRPTGKCEITMCHGDLRLQQGTVAVGHYRDAPLIHAERELDVLLDGELSRNRRLDLYPGQLGSSEVFRSDIGGIGPDCALVIGLGQLGDLAPAELTQTLTKGFMRYAVRTRNEPRRNLSTLLIGHRDSMVSVRESVRAILDAVSAANARLAEDDIAIRHLTILELFEDTAIEASEVLDTFLQDRTYDDSLTIRPLLRTGPAGRRRARFGRDQDWEQVIGIAVDPQNPTRLRFEVPTRSALVNVGDLSVDLDQVNRLMRISEKDVGDPEIGKLLFQTLVPAPLRPVFHDGRNLVLRLDQTAATYPWELLHSPRSDEPLAIRANVLRQMRDNLDPARPALGTHGDVLLIGDPISGMAELPNARVEVENVAALFKARGYRAGAGLRSFVGESFAIEPALFLGANRVLHFAGHGVHGDQNDPTGLVIGDGVVLTKEKIAQVETIPEFVFLNACYGGRFQRRALSEIAANVALQFMRMGSKAVIAAGWQIDDARAQTFASEFYEAFLGGAPFSDALLRARKAIWGDSGGGTTWGAYQCYGDPQYTLRATTVHRAVPQPPVRLTAITQAVVELETLATNARFIRTAADCRAGVDALHVLRSEIARRPEWLGDARLLERQAIACAELGLIDDAIDLFENAMACTPPLYSAQAADTLMELTLRRAIRRREQAESVADTGPQTPDLSLPDAIQAETETLDYVLAGLRQGRAGGLTVARRLAIGDTLLRKAASAASGSKARAKALAEAEESYGAVQSIIPPEDDTALAHAAIRLAVARYFQSLEQGEPLPPRVRSAVSGVVAALDDPESPAPDFTRARLLAEARLFHMLNDPQGAVVARGEILADFARAFQGGASIRARTEVVDDLSLVARLLIDRNPDAAHGVKMVADGLQSLTRMPPTG